MSDKSPEIAIPTDGKSAEELALEGDEDEPGVTEQQRRNIARVQAKLIGDCNPDE